MESCIDRASCIFKKCALYEVLCVEQCTHNLTEKLISAAQGAETLLKYLTETFFENLSVGNTVINN